MRLHEVPGSEWLGVAIETGLLCAVVAVVGAELTSSVTLKSTLFPVVAWVCKGHQKYFLTINIKLLTFGRNGQRAGIYRKLIRS